MKKAFKYRIYPTKRQTRLLDRTLGICCELYNAGLQERRDAYRTAGISINYHAQALQLPEIKKTREDLKGVNAQVLQETLKRLDLAFQAFFRRIKAGEKPGFPRFRSRSRYDSFTYPQGPPKGGFEFTGNMVAGAHRADARLALSKIGHIKIKLHRPIEGQVKTCTIIRSATGKWYACFSCEVQARPLPENTKAVGADAGLLRLLTLSNGEKFDAPEFFRKEERELARGQRKLSAATKGSRERKQRRKVVARTHERIANKRNNFAHQLSRALVLAYGIICFEDLRIRNMVRNFHLSKSIQDAAWRQLIQFTEYKAVEAGRRFVLVDPRYTSQNCSRCLSKVDKTLSDRIHNCPHCGLVLDRDHNAALNILALGLQCLGLSTIEAACFSYRSSHFARFDMALLSPP